MSNTNNSLSRITGNRAAHRAAQANARKGAQPHVTQLEDRSTVASFAGNTITLDDANELLIISTNTSGTYTLTSTVDVNGTTGSMNFTPAAGLVTVVDAVAGAGLSFGGSAVEFANPFTVTLDGGSGGVSFTGASPSGRTS